MNETTEKSIRVSQIVTGFLEIPNKISLNIYAQGCGIHCPGCQNEQIQNFNGGISITYQQLKQSIEEHKLCEWICWLGGDATFQSESLIEFNSLIKRDFPNLKICLYTGRLFKDLDERIKYNVDLIIDGPWKGIPVTQKGTNQKIYMNDRNGWKTILDWETLIKVMSERN